MSDLAGSAGVDVGVGIDVGPRRWSAASTLVRGGQQRAFGYGSSGPVIAAGSTQASYSASVT